MTRISGKLQIAHTAYYSLCAPEVNEPVPLLLALHGFGQSAAEFIRVFEPLVDRNLMIAAPQAPHQFYTNLAERRVGFSWLTRYERDQSIQDFVGYMTAFTDLLGRDFTVDPERVFVLGFSQGVSMAYRLWVHGDVPLKGIIACGGDLPPDVALQLPLRSPIRVLLIHGSGDLTVPVTKAHNASAMLQQYGYPVELLEFEGEHLIPAEAVERIGSFMVGKIEPDLDQN